MIPSGIGEETKSPGEHEVFRRLQNDPETSDWIVLHSLDISHHRTQIVGEADFVVLVPDYGVLCLEIKAHASIRRVGGVWFYGSSIIGDRRGPFRQASDAMHSIRERVAKKRPDLSGIPFWSAVVFPYVDFSVQSDEWQPWQLLDGSVFRSRPLSESIISVLVQARKFLLERSVPWFVDDGRPSLRQCEDIVSVLRPDFEFYESPRARIRALDTEVIRYTEEQFSALDTLAQNARIVFEGPAGTGKTLLAIEAARRAANDGKRVLFLCFNNLLGRWLRDELQAVKGVTAGTLHRHMLDVSKLPVKPSSDSNFWKVELPGKALDALLDATTSSFVYDELVVDEAQDLIDARYLDFLDLSLDGGLATGSWKFFADFERQSIYELASAASELLKTRAPTAVRCTLRINCRNTPRIAELAQLLGRLSPKYKSVRRGDDGVEPQIRFYEDCAQQEEQLLTELQRLYRDGFEGKDIVVLSPSAIAPCAAGIGTAPWADRLRPLSESFSGGIGYTTIYAFKGLEARAVILTDIVEIGTEHSSSIFYTGVTRALHSLTILAADSVRAQARKLLFDLQ
jgi:hypothetical protein